MLLANAYYLADNIQAGDDSPYYSADELRQENQQYEEEIAETFADFGRSAITGY